MYIVDMGGRAPGVSSCFDLIHMTVGEARHAAKLANPCLFHQLIESIGAARMASTGDKLGKAYYV